MASSKLLGFLEGLEIHGFLIYIGGCFRNPSFKEYLYCFTVVELDHLNQVGVNFDHRGVDHRESYINSEF